MSQKAPFLLLPSAPVELSCIHQASLGHRNPLMAPTQVSPCPADTFRDRKRAPEHPELLLPTPPTVSTLSPRRWTKPTVSWLNHCPRRDAHNPLLQPNLAAPRIRGAAEVTQLLLRQVAALLHHFCGRKRAKSRQKSFCLAWRLLQTTAGEPKSWLQSHSPCLHNAIVRIKAVT